MGKTQLTVRATFMLNDGHTVFKNLLTVHNAKNRKQIFLCCDWLVGMPFNGQCTFGFAEVLNLR